MIEHIKPQRDGDRVVTITFFKRLYSQYRRVTRVLRFKHALYALPGKGTLTVNIVKKSLVT